MLCLIVSGHQHDGTVQKTPRPLHGWFESSVPDLQFVGALAGHYFGPLCRFVAGVKVPARQIARHALRTV